MAHSAAGQPLLRTFQSHIDDMRNQILCKICIKPLYEPFMLACGHTYCYSCLTYWFTREQNRRRRKDCPDCRAQVTLLPAQNYVLRDLVHMFVSRVELLPEGETTLEHADAIEEEAENMTADKTGQGLFRGAFRNSSNPVDVRGTMRLAEALHDPHDNVDRCPECHWELEDGECGQCGWYDSADEDEDEDEDSVNENASHVTIDSDVDELDPVDHDFDGEPVDDFNAPWDTDESVDGESVGRLASQGPGSDAPTDYDHDDHDDYAEDAATDGFIDDEEAGEDDADSIGSFHRDAINTAIDDYPEPDSPDTEQRLTSVTVTQQVTINHDYDEEGSDLDSDETDEPPIPQTRRRPQGRIVDDDSEDNADDSGVQDGDDGDAGDGGESEDSDDTATAVQPPARNRTRGNHGRVSRAPGVNPVVRRRMGEEMVRAEHALYPHLRRNRPQAQHRQSQQTRQHPYPQEARHHPYPPQTARRSRPFRPSFVA